MSLIIGVILVAASQHMETLWSEALLLIIGILCLASFADSARNAKR